MNRPCALLALALVAPAASVAADKMKPAEVVAHHLDAVGTPEARAAARHLQGSCVMSAPASGGVAGQLVGRFKLDSEPARFGLEMKFSSEGYSAETFGVNAGEPQVGFVLPGRRSALGNFVSTNDVILREGLLGGVLNAGWPLLAAEERGAKLGYDGLKKLDGQERHRIRYRAKKGQGDLEVFLYLEPDTFRHVASVYRDSQAQQLGLTMESSSSQSDTYLQLTETFGDFKSDKGLNVPSTWTIRYELQGKVTQYWKYELNAEGLGK
jgi:hypothetical protein